MTFLFILEFELFDTYSKWDSSFFSDRWVYEVSDSLVIISLGMLAAANATVKVNNEMSKEQSRWMNDFTKKCLLRISPKVLVRNTIDHE